MMKRNKANWFKMIHLNRTPRKLRVLKHEMGYFPSGEER
jgi:hypothetical protein